MTKSDFCPKCHFVLCYCKCVNTGRFPLVIVRDGSGPTAEFTVRDEQGVLVFSTGGVDELASHLDSTVASVRVSLSRGGGTFTRGRKAKLTITQVKSDIKPGPQPTLWRYVAWYPDAELDDVYWHDPNEVTFEEAIFLATKKFFQKLSEATAEHRLALPDGLAGGLRKPKNYHYERVVIKRYQPELVDEELAQPGADARWAQARVWCLENYLNT